MRIGFIGTGSMGGMLAKAFVRLGMPDFEVAGYNRTSSKLERIVEEFPNVRQADSAFSLAKMSDLIFICVKQGDVQAVLDEIKPHLTPDQFFVSINSAWSISELESQIPCKTVKIIPSITQEALSGVMLTMYGSRMNLQDRQHFESVCSHIAFPVVINESDVRVCSDLTSCGPAFISQVLLSFSDAAVRQGGIPQELADRLVKYTIYGVGKLFVEEQYTFEQVLSRVTVPGGVTEEGLKVLSPGLDGLFDRVLLATKLHKHK
jgi:competence protein ComER